MTYKNNKAAEAILKRESGAAEQVSVQSPPFPTAKLTVVPLTKQLPSTQRYLL